jgi:hypothetical protein
MTMQAPCPCFQINTGTPRDEPIIFSKASLASRTDMLFTTEFLGDPPPD